MSHGLEHIREGDRHFYEVFLALLYLLPEDIREQSRLMTKRALADTIFQLRVNNEWLGVFGDSQYLIDRGSYFFVSSSLQHGSGTMFMVTFVNFDGAPYERDFAFRVGKDTAMQLLTKPAVRDAYKLLPSFEEALRSWEPLQEE